LNEYFNQIFSDPSPQATDSRDLSGLIWNFFNLDSAAKNGQHNRARRKQFEM